MGDWLVVNYHLRYEPGQIVMILSERVVDDSIDPLYRMDFGRFTLHLAGDALSRDARR